MRRFRFRLEQLLWHRRSQEEIAEQALARALRQEDELAADLARVRGEAASEAARLRALLQSPTTGAEMVLHSRYEARLADRDALLARRREVVLGIIGDRRAALRERRRAHEVVARLRERAWVRHRRAAEREAQLELDEAAGIRHTRRIGETVDAQDALAREPRAHAEQSSGSWRSGDWE